MGRSPLDTAFAGGKSRKQARRGFASIAVLGIAGIASASSVFAASVSINGGPISYTQGTQVIAACDTDGITTSLGSFYDASFASGGTTGHFVLDKISLADVDSGCDNKALTLELYDGSTKLLTVTGTLNTPSDGTTVNINTDNLVIEAETSNAVSNGASGANAWTAVDGNVAVTFNSGDAAGFAANADRIVVEVN